MSRPSDLLKVLSLLSFTALIGQGCTLAYDFSECTPSDCEEGFTCDTESGLCVSDTSTGSDTLVDGVSRDAIRTVGIADISGSLQDLGEGMRDGVLAAYAAHNASGTGRYTFEHSMRDDKYDPMKTVQFADEVTKDQRNGEGRIAFAVVGSMGSPTSSAMLPTLNERQVPLFGTYSGANHLRKEVPDRMVWNTRASYRLEGETITKHLLNRDPNPVPPENIFAFSQSPLDITTQGKADLSRAVAAGEDGSLDPYGLSGYTGIVDALKDELGSQTDIPLASYRATGTKSTIAQNFYFRWLGGLETRFDGPNLDATTPQIGISMIAVASAANDFVQGVINGMNTLGSGEKPDALSQAEWDAIDPDRKLKLRNLALTITSISPVGDQLAINLESAGANIYCTGEYPILVSQVVPFPNGQSGGAIQFREELDARDSNVDPGYVNFEGWIAGKVFVAAVESIEGEVTVDSLIETLEDPSFSVDLRIGSPISFSSGSHDGSNTVYGSLLADGCTYEEFTFQDQ